jgi:hypothetical protein
MNDRLNPRIATMPFVVSSVLPDSQIGGLLPGAALVSDLARMFRELGVQFLRASVVRMSSMAFQAAWSISDHGEVSDGPADRGLDSVFPGASQTINQLARSATDDTLVQKLSPRQWAYGWRLDDENALICEVHYRDRRDSVSDIDSAMVRLVCSASLRGSLAAVPVSVEDEASAAWPAVERRASPQLPWTRAVAMMLATGAALLSAWLMVSPLPTARDALGVQQAQLDRLTKAADGALMHGLAVAMATGDYGEVQTELSQFHALDYFGAAAVVNERGRVVALDGPMAGVRIGDPLAVPLAGAPRTLPLALGTQSYGQVVLTPATSAPRASNGSDQAADAQTALTDIRWSAGLLVLICSLAACALAFRPRSTYKLG